MPPEDGPMPEELSRRLAAARARQDRPRRTWPYVVLVTFMAAGDVGTVLLANYHSHSPFCNVAWDSWITLDEYGHHRLGQQAALDKIERDLASMEFHLEALARTGDTARERSYGAVRSDVSALESVVHHNAPLDYTTFEMQDLGVALTEAGCRGFAPHSK